MGEKSVKILPLKMNILSIEDLQELVKVSKQTSLKLDYWLFTITITIQSKLSLQNLSK